MKELFSIIKRINVNSILKQCIKTNLFFILISELFILGFSLKSLEILRLVLEYKLNKKIQKKFVKNKLVNLPKENEEFKTSKIIWVCWFQGFDNAPELVKTCLQSIKNNMKDYDIVEITSDNFHNYTTIPDYIIDKWKKGLISNTHFSDLLRLNLLFENGGIWIDSTVYMTDKIKNKYILEAELFLFQNLKPGCNGSTLNISSWFIIAKKNNRIIFQVQEILFSYWKKNVKLLDYFLLHHIFSIVLDLNKDELKKIPPFPNSIPHLLLFELNNKFDEDKFDYLCSLTPVHKLTYKIKNTDSEIESFHKKIVNRDMF